MLNWAESGCAAVITRKGSSLQPTRCTSSASRCPTRGSDSKRTASFSTGNLEQIVSQTGNVFLLHNSSV